MQLKPKPDYVDIDAPCPQLPKHGHLGDSKTPVWEAAEPAITAGYAQLWELPDWPSIRQAAGDAKDTDAAMLLPGGPVRGRDVITEKLRFPARDGQEIELKVYKAPDVQPNATLMYRMHGGGRLRYLRISNEPSQGIMRALC